MTNEYKILGDLQVFVCVGGEAAASRLLCLSCTDAAEQPLLLISL